MRIRNFHAGVGEKLTPTSHKGDTFFVLDGDHAMCKKPTVTLGVGFKIEWDENVYMYKPALLMRCMACYGSFTLAGVNTPPDEHEKHKLEP